MEQAKIIKKIDIKATLEAMPKGSMLVVPFKESCHASIVSACRRDGWLKQYAISLNSKEMTTTIIRR